MSHSLKPENLELGHWYSIQPYNPVCFLGFNERDKRQVVLMFTRSSGRYTSTGSIPIKDINEILPCPREPLFTENKYSDLEPGGKDLSEVTGILESIKTLLKEN